MRRRTAASRSGALLEVAVARIALLTALRISAGLRDSNTGRLSGAADTCADAEGDGASVVSQLAEPLATANERMAVKMTGMIAPPRSRNGAGENLCSQSI